MRWAVQYIAITNRNITIASHCERIHGISAAIQFNDNSWTATNATHSRSDNVMYQEQSPRRLRRLVMT